MTSNHRSHHHEKPQDPRDDYGIVHVMGSNCDKTVPNAHILQMVTVEDLVRAGRLTFFFVAEIGT